jgi:hypothetical protein
MALLPNFRSSAQEKPGGRTVSGAAMDALLAAQPRAEAGDDKDEEADKKKGTTKAEEDEKKKKDEEAKASTERKAAEDDKKDDDDDDDDKKKDAKAKKAETGEEKNKKDDEDDEKAKKAEQHRIKTIYDAGQKFGNEEYAYHLAFSTRRPADEAVVDLEHAGRGKSKGEALGDRMAGVLIPAIGPDGSAPQMSMADFIIKAGQRRRGETV